MKLKDIKSKIQADTYGFRNGIFTLRWGFFYTNGLTIANYVNLVKEKFPSAKICDYGETWKEFKGGTSVANQSHWFVKFTLESQNV